MIMYLNIIQYINMKYYLQNQSLEVNQSECDVKVQIFNQQILIKQKKQQNKRGFWTKQQQICYYYHVKEHFEQFSGPSNQKAARLFKALASKMKIRSPKQVRNHHQKMMKKYQTLKNILQQLQIQYLRGKSMIQNDQEDQSLQVNQSQCDISNDSLNQAKYNNNIKNKERYWTKQEQFCYYSHIKENLAQFSVSTNKRVTKVFKALALKMKIKSPQQVRSHHQKMMKKYQTLENLIQQLEIQHRRDETGTKQIQKQIKQIEQQQDNLSNFLTATTLCHQQENNSFIKYNQDEILQNPIGFEEQYLFYNDIKQSNLENYQLFTD